MKKKFNKSKKSSKKQKQDKALEIAKANNLLSCAVFSKISKVGLGAKKKYKKIKRLIEEIVDEVEEFKDPEFIPDNSLLEPLVQQNSKLVKFMAWYRIHNFFQTKYSVFTSVRPSQQVIRNRGYVYLMDAINVISTQPGLVFRLFEKRKTCREGVYSLWLNINGSWINVIVDDFIPIYGDHNEKTQFFFSCPNPVEKEIWFCLLEKALAKVYGGYHRLFHGFENYVVRDLTGAPHSIYDIPHIGANKPIRQREVDHMNTLWEKIFKCLRKGYILSAVPRLPTNREKADAANKQVRHKNYYLSKGLYSGHNYAIVTLKEVTGSNGNQDRILKVRNPWINERWTGDWRRDCPLWTPELREELVYYDNEDNNDGEFWMSLKDFMGYFECFNIYKTIPGFTYNSVEVKLKNQRFVRSVVRISVATKGKYTFSANQIELRSYNNKALKYSPVKLTLGKLEKNSFKLLSHTSSTKLRNTYIRKLIEKGEYYLLIEKNHLDETREIISRDPGYRSINNIVIGSYGPATCGLKIVEDGIKNDSTIFDYLCYYGWRSYSEQRIGQKLSDFKINFYDGSWNELSLYLLSVPDYIIYAFKNEHKFGIEVQTQIAGIENREIVGPEGRISFKQTFSMNPGGSDVFILRETQIQSKNVNDDEDENFQIKSVVGKKYRGTRDKPEMFKKVHKFLKGQKSSKKHTDLEKDDNLSEKVGVYWMKTGKKIPRKKEEIKMKVKTYTMPMNLEQFQDIMSSPPGQAQTQGDQRENNEIETQADGAYHEESAPVNLQNTQNQDSVGFIDPKAPLENILEEEYEILDTNLKDDQYYEPINEEVGEEGSYPHEQQLQNQGYDERQGHGYSDEREQGQEYDDQNEQEYYQQQEEYYEGNPGDEKAQGGFTPQEEQIPDQFHQNQESEDTQQRQNFQETETDLQLQEGNQDLQLTEQQMIERQLLEQELLQQKLLEQQLLEQQLLHQQLESQKLAAEVEAPQQPQAQQTPQQEEELELQRQLQEQQRLQEELQAKQQMLQERMAEQHQLTQELSNRTNPQQKTAAGTLPANPEDYLSAVEKQAVQRMLVNINEENYENILEREIKRSKNVDETKISRLLTLQKEDLLLIEIMDLLMLIKYFGVQSFSSVYVVEDEYMVQVTQSIAKHNLITKMIAKKNIPVQETSHEPSVSHAEPTAISSVPTDQTARFGQPLVPVLQAQERGLAHPQGQGGATPIQQAQIQQETLQPTTLDNGNQLDPIYLSEYERQQQENQQLQARLHQLKILEQQKIYEAQMNKLKELQEKEKEQQQKLLEYYNELVQQEQLQKQHDVTKKDQVEGEIAPHQKKQHNELLESQNLLERQIKQQKEIIEKERESLTALNQSQIPVDNVGVSMQDISQQLDDLAKEIEEVSPYDTVAKNAGGKKYNAFDLLVMKQKKEADRIKQKIQTQFGMLQRADFKKKSEGSNYLEPNPSPGNNLPEDAIPGEDSATKMKKYGVEMHPSKIKNQTQNNYSPTANPFPPSPELMKEEEIDSYNAPMIQQSEKLNLGTKEKINQMIRDKLKAIKDKKSASSGERSKLSPFSNVNLSPHMPQNDPFTPSFNRDDPRRAMENTEHQPDYRQQVLAQHDRFRSFSDNNQPFLNPDGEDEEQEVLISGEDPNDLAERENGELFNSDEQVMMGDIDFKPEPSDDQTKLLIKSYHLNAQEAQYFKAASTFEEKKKLLADRFRNLPKSAQMSFGTLIRSTHNSPAVDSTKKQSDSQSPNLHNQGGYDISPNQNNEVTPSPYKQHQMQNNAISNHPYDSSANTMGTTARVIQTREELEKAEMLNQMEYMTKHLAAQSPGMGVSPHSQNHLVPQKQGYTPPPPDHPMFDENISTESNEMVDTQALRRGRDHYGNEEQSPTEDLYMRQNIQGLGGETSYQNPESFVPVDHSFSGNLPPNAGEQINRLPGVHRNPKDIIRASDMQTISQNYNRNNNPLRSTGYTSANQQKISAMEALQKQLVQQNLAPGPEEPSLNSITPTPMRMGPAPGPTDSLVGQERMNAGKAKTYYEMLNQSEGKASEIGRGSEFSQVNTLTTFNPPTEKKKSVAVPPEALLRGSRYQSNRPRLDLTPIERHLETKVADYEPSVSNLAPSTILNPTQTPKGNNHLGLTPTGNYGRRLTPTPQNQYLRTGGPNEQSIGGITPTPKGRVGREVSSYIFNNQNGIDMEHDQMNPTPQHQRMAHKESVVLERAVNPAGGLTRSILTPSVDAKVRNKFSRTFHNTRDGSERRRVNPSPFNKKQGRIKGGNFMSNRTINKKNSHSSILLQDFNEMPKKIGSSSRRYPTENSFNLMSNKKGKLYRINPHTGERALLSPDMNNMGRRDYDGSLKKIDRTSYEGFDNRSREGSALSRKQMFLSAEKRFKSPSNQPYLSPGFEKDGSQGRNVSRFNSNNQNSTLNAHVSNFITREPSSYIGNKAQANIGNKEQSSYRNMRFRDTGNASRTPNRVLSFVEGSRVRARAPAELSRVQAGQPNMDRSRIRSMSGTRQNAINSTGLAQKLASRPPAGLKKGPSGGDNRAAYNSKFGSLIRESGYSRVTSQKGGDYRAALSPEGNLTSAILRKNKNLSYASQRGPNQSARRVNLRAKKKKGSRRAGIGSNYYKR